MKINNMIKLGENKFKTIILLLSFSIIITIQSILYSHLNKYNSIYSLLAVTIGFSTKLLSGFLECSMRKTFRKPFSQPFSLKIKDYLIYLFIILLEIVILLPIAFGAFNSQTNLNIYYLNNNLQIIFICIFTKLVFHYKISKHKIIGLFIIVGVIIPLLFYFQIKLSKTFLSFLIYILSEGIKEVLEKYLFQIRQQNPYLLIFVTGIGQSCYLIVLFILTNHFYNQDNIDRRGILFLIFCAIFQGAYTYMVIAINYKFSPSHKLISESFSYIFVFLDYYVFSYDTKAIVAMIGCFICFIGSLIYNEIIVLTICNLDSDTEKEINERALSEEIEDIETLTKEINKQKQLLIEQLDKQENQN